MGEHSESSAAEDNSKQSTHLPAKLSISSISELKKILYNKNYLAGIAVAFVLLMAFILFRPSSVSDNVPSYTLKKSNFLVTITESGEIRAKSSLSISAPRVRGSLKITFLVPEGSYIKPGDVVAKFDPTEAMTKLRDTEAQLEIALSNKDKLVANQTSDMARMDSDLKSAELSYELSKLNLEQMKFEAEAKRREAQLQHQKNELSYLQTKQTFESKKIIQQSEMNNMNVEIRQKQNELDKAKRELDDLTLTAESEGLVVYGINWNNDGRKFQIGDQAWGGQPIVNLPDLSSMESRTSVNEVDVSKVKNGQKVIITLDAFQDTSFTGEVADVARLGKEKDSNSKIKIFDINVNINGTSELLKPGMTTSNKIIINEIPDTLFIPQEAVFRNGEEYIVYKKNGSGYESVVVEIGERSEDYVLIKNGLVEGEVVALINPFSENETQNSESPEKPVDLPNQGN